MEWLKHGHAIIEKELAPLVPEISIDAAEKYFYLCNEKENVRLQQSNASAKTHQFKVTGNL